MLLSNAIYKRIFHLPLDGSIQCLYYNICTMYTYTAVKYELHTAPLRRRRHRKWRLRLGGTHVQPSRLEATYNIL